MSWMSASMYQLVCKRIARKVFEMPKGFYGWDTDSRVSYIAGMEEARKQMFKEFDGDE